MSTFIDIEHRSFEATLTRCAELGGVDLIVTSPPYPTEVPGAKGREGAPTRDYGGDAPKHFLWEDYQQLGELTYQALRPGGFCIVMIDGPVRTVDKDIGSERSTIAFQLGEDWRWTKRYDGKRYRYVEHEVYLRDGAPGDYFPRARSGFEFVHIFQRPGERGFFDAWAETLPAKSVGKRKKNACGARMWSGQVVNGKVAESHFVQPARRTLTTAIAASEAGPTVSAAVAHTEHPAPFTGYWARVQVRRYSRPGARVCDPFLGSGTVGEVAIAHGCQFIGGDLGVCKKGPDAGRRWADIAKERAEAAKVQGASKLRAVRAPQVGPQLDLLGGGA